MERQTQTRLLSREERAALDAAILDMCAFNAEPGTANTPVSSGFLRTPLRWPMSWIPRSDPPIIRPPMLLPVKNSVDVVLWRIARLEDQLR